MLNKRQKTKKRSGPKPKTEKQKRKERVLTQGISSVSSSIADAVVAKDGNLFFLSEPNGNVPMLRGHGFGLYYHDCRFVNGYVLRIAGTGFDQLGASSREGYTTVFELSNPDIKRPGGHTVHKESVGLNWKRTVSNEKCSLVDVLRFTNYDMNYVEFPVDFDFRSGFEDVFMVRGLLPEKRGKINPPEWKSGALFFSYDGADGVLRSVTIRFSPKPARRTSHAAHYDVKIEPRSQVEITVELMIGETSEKRHSKPAQRPEVSAEDTRRALKTSSDKWLENIAQVKSDSVLFNSVIERSFRDLHVLRSQLHNEHYYAAGVPWFVALFGRDSLVTAIQMLAFTPEIAPETLRLLAQYQGTKIDDWRDEQPGKILHELRVGELAQLHEIPHTPYYGTIDATLLFLIAIGLHASWTGSLELFHELQDNIRRALVWMDDYGDSDQDGYIEYQSSSSHGLVNQGWKDSGDAIVRKDGQLAIPPIALAEVQGYAYMARLVIAELYERSGDTPQAQALRDSARQLRERFNRDFWLSESKFFAMALEKGNHPLAVISSNPGQALWTGIIDEDKAGLVVKGLMGDQMFSGWGVRTLSEREWRYNPVSYHLGSVWPHDNAFIAAGCRRYGRDHAALAIFEGIVNAAMHFNNYRLPELFSGFRRQDYSTPVRYPVACHPQAWAAGSVPFLLQTSLGLHPDGFSRRLRIVRPVLPEFIDRMELHGIRVADGSVDLKFERKADHFDCQVLGSSGKVEVEVS